jgi:hypothetical protein
MNDCRVLTVIFPATDLEQLEGLAGAVPNLLVWIKFGSG